MSAAEKLKAFWSKPMEPSPFPDPYVDYPGMSAVDKFKAELAKRPPVFGAPRSNIDWELYVIAALAEVIERLEALEEKSSR